MSAERHCLRIKIGGETVTEETFPSMAAQARLEGKAKFERTYTAHVGKEKAPVYIAVNLDPERSV
jgi:hypothetical protein